MSATASWTIFCDGCGDMMSAGDLSSATAQEARDEAKRLGGHRSGKMDVCFDCWAEGLRGRWSG